MINSPDTVCYRQSDVSSVISSSTFQSHDVTAQSLWLEASAVGPEEEQLGGGLSGLDDHVELNMWPHLRKSENT